MDNDNGIEYMQEPSAAPQQKGHFHIEGFERSLYARDRFAVYYAAETNIEPVTVFVANIMGYEERSAMLGTEALCPGSMEYSTKNCTVSSKTVSADELIKMLESLA